LFSLFIIISYFEETEKKFVALECPWHWGMRGLNHKSFYWSTSGGTTWII